jgi:hypothetical protein
MRLLEHKDEQLFLKQRQHQYGIAIDIVDGEGKLVQEYVDIHDTSIFVTPVPPEVRHRVGLSSFMGELPVVHVKQGDNWKKLVLQKAEESVPAHTDADAPPLKEAA